MKQLPLKGYRVVNFGWVAAAPMAASFLADMGAEVIKVESTKRIDSLRLSPDNLDLDPDKDPWFHSGSRSQLSITVDLASPKVILLLKRLIGMSHVVLENFSPGTMKELGLDYDSLREVNPEIIMISMSATGQYGPLRNAVTYGPSLNGLASIDSLIGYRGERVLGMQQPYADSNSAIHGAFVVLVALYYYRKTGKGQYIDMAQLETLLSTMGAPLMEYVMTGRVLETIGNWEPTMAPHNNYRCKGDDKWVSIAVKTEDEWQGFCQAMGNPSWTKEEKFADRYRRLQNQEALDELINQWTVNYTDYEVMEMLQKVGVAAAPCLDTEGRFFDPHFKERGLCIEMEHPATGVDWIAGVSWKLGKTPAEVHRAPLLGEHNDYVFGELLGLSTEEITSLKEEGVLQEREKK